MTKRLTANEIADQLEADAKSYEGWAWYSGIDHAKAAQQIREHLIPRWRDEPEGPKDIEARYHYWVNGKPFPCVVQWAGDTWIIKGAFGAWEPLAGRKVCPIDGPPAN